MDLDNGEMARKEATVIIGETALSVGQSLAVRMAISEIISTSRKEGKFEQEFLARLKEAYAFIIADMKSSRSTGERGGSMKKTIIVRLLVYEGPEDWVKKVCMERRSVKEIYVADRIPGEDTGGTIRETIIYETTFEGGDP